MTCGTFKTSQVPADQVDDVMSGYQANVPAPTSVSKAEDADGTYTVTAVFPDCPPSTTHDSKGSGAKPAAAAAGQ
jgi:hypothetical protein